MSMTYAFYKTLFKSIIQSNGASFNFQTGEINPITGYMVALEDFEYDYRIPECAHELADIVLDYVATPIVYNKIKKPFIYIGFWINEGRLIVDLSENIMDRETAMAKGLERNQLAIYDCLDKQDIKIPILSDYDES